MESSMGVGFVAVFAVTGSVVLLAHQVHKRLLSDFMKDMEFELSGGRAEKMSPKKSVKFAEDVVEPSSNNKEYRKRHLEKLVEKTKEGNGYKIFEETNMPLNRQALYRGIIEYKVLKGQNVH